MKSSWLSSLGFGKGRKPNAREREARRRFLRGAVLSAAVVALQPLAWIPVVGKWQSRLRPPGALAEPEFLAACIKCGQCVQVCPVEALKLADLSEGLGVGVPYIDARNQACDFSCDALSCILACPTGALVHETEKKENVRMGLARLARPEACLARRGEGFHGPARGSDFRGLLRYEEIDRWVPVRISEYPYEREICDLCVLECPLGADAITLEPLPGDVTGTLLTPVVHEGCVGCGVCEMICPAEPACIIIDERRQWGQPA